MSPFRLPRKLVSRILAYATMEDRYFSAVLSPAVTSLRLADGFVRNVLVLMSGTTIAMIIPLAVSPLLTRLYTPHDYGLFALYMSIVSVISVPISGNYDAAVMLPRKDEDAANLAALCFGISFVASSLLLFVSWFFGGRAGVILGNRNISAWLGLVPLTTFIMGLQQTLSYWANRKRQFKRLSTNRVVESLVTPLVSLLLGFGSAGMGGLVAGLLGGKAAATWMLGRGVWGEKKKGQFTLSRKVIFEQARRYSDFPLYSAPTSFFDTLALQVPVFLLTKFFDPYVVGWFALTVRVIGAPLALVATCVGQVYYQWISEATRRDADLRSYVIQVARYLALFVLLPVLAAVLFSPVLFRFVFGSQWGTAGEYARILVLPLAAKFVVAPLTTIMPASGNIKLGSVWKTIYLCSTIAVLYVAAHFSAKIFLCIYAAHDLFFYGIYFFLILKASTNLKLPERGASDSAPGFKDDV